MMQTENARLCDFFDFLCAAPTPYHTVLAVKERLCAKGFTPLCPGQAPLPGGAYYLERGGSALIAFRMPAAAPTGFMISAVHGDSPAFRIRGGLGGTYPRLSVEKYGGMILSSWLDRPLSVAGCVTVETDKGLCMRPVDLKAPLALIPSVAPHLDRGGKEKREYSVEGDMPALLGIGADADILMTMVATAVGVKKEQLLSQDLRLYVAQRGVCLGVDGGLLSAPRLDDLGCAYAALCAFLSATHGTAVPVFALFDHEEIGSSTGQGAASDFLAQVLSLIGGDGLCALLQNSLLVSADNAHAIHPNHPEYTDAALAPTLGGGVTVKRNAARRYATDPMSEGLFSLIARRADVKLSYYENRPDIPGGSTLGSIAATGLGIPTVDIGLPQLAMHSAVETMAACDLFSMERVLTRFFQTALKTTENGVEIL